VDGELESMSALLLVAAYRRALWSCSRHVCRHWNRNDEHTKRALVGGMIASTLTRSPALDMLHGRLTTKTDVKNPSIKQG